MTFISMGSSTFVIGYFEYHCCIGGCLLVIGALREMLSAVVVYVTLSLIRYESSRGRKIDGTKPNQTGKNCGEKNPGKADRRNGQESSQQRTSSPERDTEETNKYSKSVDLCVARSPESVRSTSMGSCTFVPVFFNTIAAPVENILKRGRLQITDSVVLVQDDRMGFHICIVGY